MIFSIFIFISLALITLAYGRNVLSSHKYIQQNNSIKITINKNKVIVLIPIYNEHEILKSTFYYFYQLASSLDINVIFITTELEASMVNNQSYQILNNLIGDKKHILLEHYPKKIGSKANQLNWVMDKYAGDTDYFAVFDADSRPDLRGISFVLQAKNRTAIFQMPSIYTPHALNTLASKSLAVFQTRWSYCFEIPKWRLWQNNPQKQHVMYTVGHGLFLLNIIRFSEHTISEDLELGYRLSAQRTTMTLVPFFDYALVPQKFITSIIQSSRWYYGELLAPITFWQQYKDSSLKRSLDYAYRATVRYIQILLWMVGPVLVIASLIISVTQVFVLATGITAVFAYFFLNVIVCRYQRFSYDSLVLMPIRIFINGVGPMLCVCFTLMDILKIKKFKFIKTKR